MDGTLVELQEFKRGEQTTARVVATTYGQLTATANRRLHRLRERIPLRYENVPGFKLAQRVMGIESQAGMELGDE